MPEARILSYYEDLFAQYVGSYGYSVNEAYSKAYGILEMTEKDKKRARSISRRHNVLAKIREYRAVVEKRNIEIAAGEVAFEKTDAMKNLQNVLYKCQEALNAKEISDNDFDRLKSILESNLSLENVYEDGELVERKSQEDVEFYKAILYLVSRPSFSPKTADILLKANRQACELYNLIDNDINLKLDKDQLNAVNLLNKVASQEEIEKLAFDED